MIETPRVVIAAPSSGCGKTTVATGLMAALTAAGHTVSGHKVGPDYIDPGYHAVATGRAPRNLDPMLCGAHRIAPLFAHGAQGADIAVVEGVMGLFDGAAEPAYAEGPGDFASTAHVAHLLGAPVVLVVDAARTSRSIAALVHGFCSFDPRVRIGGVILNQVGSARHEELLRRALDDTGVPVLGAVRRDAALCAPSRHLGLIPAAERRREAAEAVAALAAVTAQSCDLAAVAALARSAAPLPQSAWRAEEELARAGLREPVAARVAVAAGPAFTFGYTEQVELLRAGGAEVATFDPLHDPRLPEGAAALVVGGGFPEVHAAQLSENAGLRADVARRAALGMPVSAECAGLLYLCRSLDGAPMCAVVDGEAEMTPSLTLGYREAVALGDSPVAVRGQRVHGHEFHRTALTRGRGGDAAWQWRGSAPEGFAAGSVHASYLHLHWGGVPEAAVRFLGAAQVSPG